VIVYWKLGYLGLYCRRKKGREKREREEGRVEWSGVEVCCCERRLFLLGGGGGDVDRVVLWGVELDDRCSEKCS
jgi:hypothetical protein